VVLIERVGSELAHQPAPIVSDCAYVVNGCHRRSFRVGTTIRLPRNADLWQRLSAALWASEDRVAGRFIDLPGLIAKVNSHLGQQGVDSGAISFQDFVGNEAADALAGAAAREIEVPRDIVDSISAVDRKAHQVITHLLRTSLLAVNFQGGEPVHHPPKKVPVEKARPPALPHTPFYSGNKNQVLHLLEVLPRQPPRRHLVHWPLYRGSGPNTPLPTCEPQRGWCPGSRGTPHWPS